ncbi:MAG: glycosyltransferase, partial [Candidatus Levyibacteriota bacterium]
MQIKAKKILDKDLPTVTIIIITKNVQRTIAKVLKAIEMQDYPRKKIDILITDGKSTDNSFEIIKKFPHLPIKIIQSIHPND